MFLSPGARISGGKKTNNAKRRADNRGNFGLAVNDLQNVSFAVTASAGALTIAMKDAFGNDPSLLAPIALLFRNVSLIASPNTLILREIAGPTSVIVPPTSTCGFSNATGARLWIIGWDDGGTFRLGVFNASTANNIYALSEYGIGSSLQVVAAGNAAGQHYTAGAAVTNKAFRILGFVDWNASGVATAGTWTTTNLNEIHTFGLGTPRPGTPTGQMVRVTSAVNTSTTTSAFVSTGLTAPIIMSSAANLVRWHYGGVATGVSNGEPQTNMFRGSTQLTIRTDTFSNATVSAATATFDITVFQSDYDLPNTSGSVTYTVKLAQLNGATSVNFPAGSVPGVIFLEEIMG